MKEIVPAGTEEEMFSIFNDGKVKQKQETLFSPSPKDRTPVTADPPGKRGAV